MYHIFLNWFTILWMALNIYVFWVHPDPPIYQHPDAYGEFQNDRSIEEKR